MFQVGHAELVSWRPVARACRTRVPSRAWQLWHWSPATPHARTQETRHSVASVHATASLDRGGRPFSRFRRRIILRRAVWRSQGQNSGSTVTDKGPAGGGDPKHTPSTQQEFQPRLLLLKLTINLVSASLLLVAFLHSTISDTSSVQDKFVTSSSLFRQHLYQQRHTRSLSLTALALVHKQSRATPDIPVVMSNYPHSTLASSLSTSPYGMFCRTLPDCPLTKQHSKITSSH